MHCFGIITVFSVGKVLEYYAVLSIICTPVNLLLLIFLSKRTNLLRRIDDYIDRLLPPIKPPQKETNVQTTQSAPITPAPAPVPTEEQARDMSGIACFEIQVGETYVCHLNYQNRGGSYGEMSWYNDNEFVGEIKDNGLFKAFKVGTSNIFCVGKGHSYDVGAQAYSIKVVSALGPWFADPFIEQLLARKAKADFLARNIKRKITKESPSKNIIVYSGSPSENSYSLTVQFDVSALLSRLCWAIHPDSKTEDQIIRRLDERFEEIELVQSNGFRIWIHQIIDNEHEEVDIYAFIKHNDRNELILGIGQTWREYGEREEFLDNIRMAIRSFGDIISYDVSAMQALTEEFPETKETDNNPVSKATDETTEPTEESREETAPDSEDITSVSTAIDDYADYTEEELNTD